MNLFIKVSKFDLSSYRKEFLECLIYNSQNSYILSINVYTDEINHKISGIPKVKVIFKKNLLSNKDIAIISNSSIHDKIILANPFTKFNNDLYKVTNNELKDFVLVNNDYFIYSKDSTISVRSQNEPIFDKPSKSISLNCESIKLELTNQTNNKNLETLVKKPVYRPVPILPTKRQKKLDVVIVSVDYNDYLILSLKHNTKIFDNITVVTSQEDTVCQEICKKYNVNCVITDVMYEDNASFNKGKAINIGIKSVQNADLILLLDADIIVDDSLNIDELSDKVLYTSQRIILPNYQTYQRHIDSGLNKKTILENDKGYGFFQLFCINNSFLNREKPFPEIYKDASYGDLEFRDKFYKRQTISQPCIHLGEAFRNWKGRVTEKFLTDEQIRELIDQIQTHNLNTYFDKIYCLNLDMRTDRWKKVKKQFDYFGIDVERWSAIEGENIDDETFFKFNPNNIIGEEASNEGLVENKNSIACLYSHLEIIKNAKLNEYKKVLILEDDVILEDTINTDIRKIKDKDWKILYLGASQFDWSKIKYLNGFYHSKKTYGTFAYAIDSSIYDELINLLENGRKSVDNLLVDYQESNSDNCLTMLPNIITTNVTESDIRQSKDQINYANLNKWSLKLNEEKKLRILLVPDTKGWAFDNIATSIIKYNPKSEKIYYKKIFVTDLLAGNKIDYDEWDYIFVFFEAERIIPPSKKVIRGCYSAFWLEHPSFSPKVIAEYFNDCLASVFVNKYIEQSVSPFLLDGHPTIVIEDASDETIFYPIPKKKNENFTAIFVGNSDRKIKNFDIIKLVCEKADIELIICKDIPHKELVNYYNKADVCINFSDFEGGPQTFIESALCEIPMIVRPNNEFSKEIPCFKADSEDELLKLINDLKNNRSLCEEIGKKARSKVMDNFTYKKVSEKFTNFFLDLELKNQLDEK